VQLHPRAVTLLPHAGKARAMDSNGVLIDRSFHRQFLHCHYRCEDYLWVGKLYSGLGLLIAPT
jgi:hypothetical protein